MIKGKTTFFLISFIISSICFLSLSIQSHAGAGLPPIALAECCQLEGDCFDIVEPELDMPVQLCSIDSVVPGFCNQETGLCEQVMQRSTSVPTLTQWGLIATAGILAIIGFIAIRRKKLSV